MPNPNFSILLSDFVFGKNMPNITIPVLNVGKPKKYMFFDSNSHPPVKGVYVIFSPQITDFNTRGDGCIYVGEGNIKQRLYSHKRKERFGNKDSEFIVICYEIEDQVDRKTVERILIKYYDPTYNKEGVSKTERVNKQSSFSIRLRTTIQDIKVAFEDLHHPNGQLYEDQFDYTAVVVNLLQEGYSLEDIDLQVTLQLKDEITIEDLAEFLNLN